MHRNCRYILLSCVCFLFSSRIQAQACSHFPADCPSDRQLGDSAQRLGNPVIPEEVHMEIRIHDFLTDLMQTLADKKKWEVYQVDESDGSGFPNADRSGPLAFNLRPPHDYEISFVFIVNPDSLHAWKEWIRHFNENMMEEVEKMKSSGDFSSVSKIQESKKIRTESFRNASMIRVKFEFNPENAIYSSITDNFQRSAVLSVPHAVLAYQFHNSKTDERAIFDLNQFTRCSELAFVLFGDWNTKPDGYQYYRPGYSSDKKNTDRSTPKKFKSDKVITIALHVEGSTDMINQFLKSLDTGSLVSILVQ